MKILLTFTGFHDPFSETSIVGETETGPVLTVAAERTFEAVYLFTTPNTAGISEQTKQELKKRNKGLNVEICPVPLADPTNYLGILKQLRTHFRKINKQHDGAEYYICVSSGTPHMHASWLMLAASGEIPARILQTRASKFTREGQSRVTEIDFTNPQFPQIMPFRNLEETDFDQDFGSICLELGIGDSLNGQRHRDSSREVSPGCSASDDQGQSCHPLLDHASLARLGNLAFRTCPVRFGYR